MQNKDSVENVQVQVHLFTLIQFQYNNNKKKKEVKTELIINNIIELNITKEKSVWQPKEPSFRVGYYHRAVTR